MFPWIPHTTTLTYMYLFRYVPTQENAHNIIKLINGHENKWAYIPNISDLGNPNDEFRMWDHIFNATFSFARLTKMWKCENEQNVNADDVDRKLEFMVILFGFT